MIARKRGAIINIASFHVTVPHVPYAASKAGVVALTHDLAYEVGRLGIRVNATAPGPIETPMVGIVRDEQRQAIAKNILLGRMGQPEDISLPLEFAGFWVRALALGRELKLPEMPRRLRRRKSVLLKAFQAFVVNVANISAPFVGVTGKRYPASITSGVVLKCELGQLQGQFTRIEVSFGHFRNSSLGGHSGVCA
jgi:hypothetical protein